MGRILPEGFRRRLRGRRGNRLRRGPGGMAILLWRGLLGRTLQAVQLLLEAEHLPLHLADLPLGFPGFVHVAFDLAPQLFRRGLGLEQFVRDIDGGQHGSVSAAHPCAA
jgi:uncharacterized protein Usg